VKESESPVRIALVGCTGLLGDVIRETLTSEPGLCVVAELNSPRGDLNVAELDAEIVLWKGADEHRVAVCLDDEIQRRAPRVLAVMTDGRRATLWELTPRRTELGALSPRTLVDIVRSTRASGTASPSRSRKLDNTFGTTSSTTRSTPRRAAPDHRRSQ
jgi:hypothetical protein